MPAPAFLGTGGRRGNDADVYLSNAAGQWHLDAGEAGSSVWVAPPQALSRLMQELFIAQPDDVLTWVNLAVWRMHEEELLHKEAKKFNKALRSSNMTVSNSQAFGDQRIAHQVPSGQPRSVASLRTSARCGSSRDEQPKPGPSSWTEQLSSGSSGSPFSAVERVGSERLGGGESETRFSSAIWGTASEPLVCDLPPVEEQTEGEISSNAVDVIAGSMPLASFPLRSMTEGSGAPESPFPTDFDHHLSGSDVSSEERPRPMLRQWPHARPATGLEVKRKSPVLSISPRAQSSPAHSFRSKSSPLLDCMSVVTMGEDVISVNLEAHRGHLMRREDAHGCQDDAVSSHFDTESDHSSSTGRDYVKERYTKADRKISFQQVGKTPSLKGGRSSATPNRLGTSSMIMTGKQKSESRVSTYTEAEATSDDWMLNFIDERVPWRKADVSRNSRGHHLQMFEDMRPSTSVGKDSPKTVLSCFILHPASPARLLWDFLFLLAFLFEVWSVPFELVFLPEDSKLPHWLDELSFAVFLFFCCDIVLNFFTGYVERNGHSVLHFGSVARHYLQYWFFVDLVATLPEAVCRAHPANLSGIKLFKLVRLLRLLRIYNWEYYIARFAILLNLKQRKLVILLVKLHLLLLLLAHLHAVTAASMQPRASWITHPNEGLLRYLEYHWRAQAALTFGSDSELLNALRSAGSDVPISGQSTLGIITAGVRFALLWLTILRLLIYASMHEAEEIEHEMLQHYVQQYLIDRRIPIPLQLEILNCIQEVATMEKCKHFVSAYSSQDHLKMQLKLSVSRELWLERLGSLGLVKELIEENTHFAEDLALSCLHEIWAPRTVLYSAGEASHSAYHILSGEVKVNLPFQQAGASSNPPTIGATTSDVGTMTHRLTTSKNKSPTDFGPGMWVGEKALINPELRRSETVLCLSWTELMMVPAGEFRKLVVYYELQEVFEELIQNKLWLGLCGRCGAFGDHFPKNCPHLSEAPSMIDRIRANAQKIRRGSWITNNLENSTSGFNLRSSGEGSGLAKDLERFLLDNDLARMLKVMEKYGIHRLDDINKQIIDKIVQDPEVDMKPAEAELFTVSKVKDFKKRLLRGATKILATTGKSDNHLVFLSHYKWNAGTEAALMQKDLERLIAEDPGNPGHDLTSPIFVDTEDLRDLNDLQTHVRKSHNLVLLLTVGVLSRPWVLIEIVTAIKTGVRVVPVEIQRPGVSFTYPDEAYYQRFVNGSELDAAATEMLSQNNITLTEIGKALRQTFKKIALPFSPHKTANVRQAELTDILRQCILRPTPSTDGTS